MSEKYSSELVEKYIKDMKKKYPDTDLHLLEMAVLQYIFLDCAKDYKQDENAWRYSDYSRSDSVAASRSRQLAEPESGGISTWTMEKYKKHMTLLDELTSVDFSFTHKYTGTGIWN